MRKKIEKIVAVVLIISMILGDAGISVLAGSVGNIVNKNEEQEKETPNYYYEYMEETTIETYDTYLEESNPDILEFQENASDEEKESDDFFVSEESENSEKETESLDDKEIDDEEIDDEEIDDEKMDDEEIDDEEIKESSDKKISGDENNKESEEGMEVVGEKIIPEEIVDKDIVVDEKKEESNSVKDNVENEESSSIDEIVESDVEITKSKESGNNDESQELKVESSEINETKKEKIKNEKNENIASESIVETVKEETIEELATDSNSIVEEIVREEKATNSKIDVVFGNDNATDSEIENVNITTSSEIQEIFVEESVIANASDSEIDDENVKNIVEIATDSKMVNDATESEINNIATKSEVKKEIIIATVSKVVWKVKKILLATYSTTYISLAKINGTEEERLSRLATCANVVLINSLGEEKVLPISLKWEKFKQIDVNEETEIGEKKVPISEIRKKYDIDKIIASEKEEVVDEVDNKNLIDAKVNEENAKLKDKQIVVVAVDADGNVESDINANSKEIEKEEKNEEILEPTVEDFANTNEIDVKEDEENATESEMEELENAIIGTESLINDYVLDEYYDLQTTYLYKINAKEFVEEIINSINKLNVEELLVEDKKEDNVEEVKEEVKVTEKKKSFIESLFGLFGLGKQDKQKENISDDENKKLIEKTTDIGIIKFLEDAKIDVLEDCVVPVFVVEQSEVKLTKGAEHFSHENHTIAELIRNDAKLYFKNSITGDLKPLQSWTLLGENTNHLEYMNNVSKQKVDISGYYYLGADLVIANEWNVDTTLSICTNGYNITFATAGCITGTGRVNICNCAGRMSKFTTTGPEYNYRDRFYGKTGKIYKRYHDKPLINVNNIGVFGGGEGLKGENFGKDGTNIKFVDNRISNYYMAQIVINEMKKGTIVDDEEISGDASLLCAKEELKVYDVLFENNIATRTNGVALNAQLGVLVVEDCVFRNNVNLTNRGGAVAFNPDAAKFYNCIFDSNVSASDGGAMYGRSYAKDIYEDLGGETNKDLKNGTTIEKVLFKNNRALNDGGAIFFDTLINVNIQGKGDNQVKFDGNRAGRNGGAIAVEHIMNTRSRYVGANNYEKKVSETEQLLKLNGVSFTNNYAIRQVINKVTGRMRDIDEADGLDGMFVENKGGAIYIEGSDTEDTVKVITGTTISNCTFTENRAFGQKVVVEKYDASGKSIGDVIDKYSLGSYGGAVYVKNSNVDFISSELDSNYSLSGANICTYNSNVNLYNSMITGGSEYSDRNNISFDGVKSYEDQFVTPGGGAVYIMKKSKVYVSKDTEIKNNINAFYLDNGNIEIGKSKIHSNYGEYLIGYTNYNYGDNTILFDGADIRNHKFVGKYKDYSIKTTYTTMDSSELTDEHNGNTFVSFRNINVIYDNKIVCKEEGKYGNIENKEYTANIMVKSSVSNLKLDLKYLMETNEKFEKIGLFYEFDPDTTIRTYIEGVKYVDILKDNDMIVFDKYNKANVKFLTNGGIWTNYFSLDGSEADGWCKGWKYYIDNNKIRISPDTIPIVFNSYIEDVPRIAPQYYNYRVGYRGLVKITTPTEIITRDMNTPNLTLLGFLQKDSSGYNDHDPNDYVLWDFENCRLELKEDTKSVEFIAVYTDDTIKVKACGCPNGEHCKHDNPKINHKDRGTAENHSEDAKYKNYVVVATPADFAYVYEKDKVLYKTQYVLYKDIVLTREEAEKYMTGDMVINLNGYKLDYDTSEDRESAIFDITKGKRNYFEEEDGNIFINGVASSSNLLAPKGVITSDGRHGGPLVLTATDSKGVYINAVKFKGVYTYPISKYGIVDSKEDRVNGLLNISNVDIENVEFKADVFGGASKIIMDNVNVINNLTANDNALVKMSSDESGKAVLKINNSTLKGMYNISQMVNVKLPINKTEINISSSSIMESKYSKAMLDIEKEKYGEATVSFVGNNVIKANEVLNGTNLLRGDAHWLFGDDDSVNIFDGNIVPNVDGNAIILLGTESEFRGIFTAQNNMAKNKGTAEISTVYQKQGTVVKLGQAGVTVKDNYTKYNWFIENEVEKETFTQIKNTKLRAKDMAVAIRLKNDEEDQLLYKDWCVDILYNENAAESSFRKDVSYDEHDTIDTYKYGKGNKSDIYLGRKYVTAKFQLYDYKYAVDERENYPYDANVEERSRQRIAKNRLVILDNPVVELKKDEVLMWEGIAYVNDEWEINDTSNEHIYDQFVRDIPVVATGNFVITGYRYRENANVKHVHDDVEFWVEARNEGHLQSTSSHAYLHNDVILTKKMLYKIKGDYKICLNGFKLIIGNDVNFLTDLSDCNIEIFDCKRAEGITEDGGIVLQTGLEGGYTKDFITMGDASLYLHDLKIAEFENVKGRFLNANFDKAKVKIDKVEVKEVKVDYEDEKNEKAFIELKKTDIATVNNLKVYACDVQGSRNDHSIISVNNTKENMDGNFENIELSSNRAYASTSVMRILNYKNVNIKSPIIKLNSSYAGTPLDIVGTAINGNLYFENVLFDENNKAYNVIATNYGIDKNSAILGFENFDKVNIKGGKIDSNYFAVPVGERPLYDAITVLNIRNTEFKVKDVTFTGNNRLSNDTGKGYAIGINGSRNVTFEDCAFLDSNAENCDFIKILSGYYGVCDIIGDTTFTNMRVRSLMDIQSSKAKINLYETNIEGISATQIFNVAGDAKLVSSNSNIVNTNGKVMVINGDNVELYNTTIDGGVSNEKEAIDLGMNHHITVGDKVIIKGFKKNVKMQKNTKIVVKPTHKLLNNSEIHLTTPDDEDFNFFDTWAKEYIEKYDTHEDKFYYFPEDIFVLDEEIANAGRKIFVSGTGNVKLYVGKDAWDKTTTYTKLYYVDKEVENRGEIATQYVDIAIETLVDRVQVDYLSTNSQSWVAELDKTDLTNTTEWRVRPNDRYTVKDLLPAVTYYIYLTEKHIHKICGLDGSVNCPIHADGVKHTIEYEFRKISSNSNLTDVIKDIEEKDDKKYYLGLTNDMTISKENLEKLAMKEDVKICLHGHILTFEKDATYTFSDITIIDCKDKGYIRASEDNVNHTLINATGKFNMYGVDFASFSTTVPVININTTDKVVIEDSKFVNMTNNNEDGLFVVENGAPYIDKLYFENNVAKDVLLRFNENGFNTSNIRSIYVENNKYNSKLISIDRTEELKINNIMINDNILVNNEEIIDTYGSIYVGNDSIFVVATDAIFARNDASIKDDSKGGVISNYGKVIFNGKVTFDSNKAGLGGAIYCADGCQELTFNKNATFVNNEAVSGAAIYAISLETETINTKDVLTFDANKNLTNKLGGYEGGVVSWGGELVLNNVVFQNHDTNCKNLIGNLNKSGDKIKLSNPVFRLNTMGTDAILLDNVEFGSYISGVDKKTNENTFTNLINILGGSCDIKDIELKENYFDFAAIKISTPMNILISTVSITRNSTNEGAVYVSGAPVKIGEKVIINNNNALVGDAKDIYIADAKSYIIPTTKISTESRLSFAVYEDGAKVFENWNKEYINYYDNPFDATGEVGNFAYAPENSYEFEVSKDAQVKEYNFYKKGTTGQDVCLGTKEKYVTITFLNDSVHPNYVYVTQNIEKGKETLLDLTDTKECILERQSWIASDSEGKEIIWSFRNPVYASYSESATVIYIKPHLHRVCGCDVSVPCVHENGVVHDEGIDYEYRIVKTLEDIKNIDTTQYQYIYLKNDIVVDGELEIPTGLLGICLNGHTITKKGNDKTLFRYDGNDEFDICNCKEEGAVKVTGHKQQTKSLFVNNSTKSLNMYNVVFASVSVAAESSILSQTVDGKMYIENMTVTGLTDIGDAGVINIENGSMYMTKTNFIGNNVGTSLLNVKNDKVTFGDLYLSENEGKVDLINVVAESGDEYEAKMKSIIATHNTIIEGSVINVKGKVVLDILDELRCYDNNTTTAALKIYNNAIVQVKSIMSFINNKNEIGNGGAINISESKLVVSTVSEFIGNKAIDGAAIYARKIPISGLILKNALFEANEATGNGIINFSGVLDLNKIVMKKHTSSTELIYENDLENNSTLNIDEIIFENNKTSQNAIETHNINDKLNISHIKEETKNNLFNRFINVEGAYINLSDNVIESNECIDSVIVLASANEVNMKNIIIASNTILNKSALCMEKTVAKVSGDIIIKNNGENKNILLLDNSSYFKGVNNGVDKLSSISEMYIEVAKQGSKIFEGWNKLNIENWGKLNYKLNPDRCMYTPENSGLFVVDGEIPKIASWSIYKKGTSSNVDVYIGKKDEDYISLRFYYLETGETVPTIDECQNIAKDVETTIDIVDAFEYERQYQQWYAPIDDEETDTCIWEMYDGNGNIKDLNAKYANNHIIYYNYRHYHRPCGLNLKNDCEHTFDSLDILEHSYTRFYTTVATVGDLAIMAKKGVKYITLANDLHLGDEKSYDFSSFDGICLNGHKLVAKSVGENDINLIYINTNQTLEICDCKSDKPEGRHGAITIEPGMSTSGSGKIVEELENTFIRLNSQAAKLYMYDMHFEDIKLKQMDNEGEKGAIPYIIDVKNGRAYLENPIFRRFTETTEEGIMTIDENGGQNSLIKLVNSRFEYNALQTKTIMLAVTNKIIISTISIVDNIQSSGGMLQIRGNDVKISKLKLEHNTTYNDGIIRIEPNAKLTLENDNIFKNNMVAENGGAVVLKGKLCVANGKSLQFVDNAADYGGALFIEKEGALESTGSVIFINNIAMHGAAIYGYDISEDSINVSDLRFDNNAVRNSGYGGIVEWVGDLKLDNPVFENHQVEKMLGKVQVYGGNLIVDGKTANAHNKYISEKIDKDWVLIESSLKLKNPIFRNNEINKKAIYISNMQLGSKVTNIQKANTMDNKFESFITVDDGYLDIDGELADNTYVDTVLDISNSKGIAISSLSITNNVTSGAAVRISNGPVMVNGKIVIQNNVGRNIYLLGDNGYLKATGLIDENSRFVIDIEKENVKVFEGWNSTNFSRFNKPDSKSNPLAYMYTPANCGIFIKDTGVSPNDEFYKKGVGKDAENIYLGNDYITLNFWNRVENPNIFYGSQYIANNVRTTVDLVDSFEYELDKQEWLLPEYNYSKVKEKMWRFYDGEITAQYDNRDAEIRYNQRHIHKECGMALMYDCNHNGLTHTTTIVYDVPGINPDVMVTTQEDIQNATKSYIILTSDIIVKGEMKIPDCVKGICLNGWKIIVEEGSKMPVMHINNRINNQLHITDCRGTGAITLTKGYKRTDDIIRVDNSKVNIYNISFENMNVTGRVLNVTNKGDVYTQNVKLTKFIGTGVSGVIDNADNTTLILDNLIVASNSVASDTPIIRLKDTMIVIGTLSIVGNSVKNSSTVELKGDIALEALEVAKNVSEGRGTIFIPKDSKLTLLNNMVFNENKARQGGAVYIEGVLDVKKNIIFERNVATDKGGAVYIRENGKLLTNNGANFIGNEAVNGSSICAEKLVYANEELKIDGSVFKEDKATGGAAVAWGGELKLSTISFMSSQPKCNSLIANINSRDDKLELEDITFTANYCSKEMISLNNIVDAVTELDKGAKLKNIQVVKSGVSNRVGNYINIKGGKAYIVNSSFAGGEYTGAGLNVIDGAQVVLNNVEFSDNVGSDMYGAIRVDGKTTKVDSIGKTIIKGNKIAGQYGAAITLTNGANFVSENILQITNNTSKKGGAVYLDGIMGVENEVYIYDNKTSIVNGKVKNISVVNENSYVYGIGKINDKVSKLGFTAEKDDATAFKSWNGDIFEKFDKPEREDVDFVYTPENSGVFMVDECAEELRQKIYKSGTGKNIDVKIGKNYITLTFATANKEHVYGTQNVEKGVETHIDRVYIDGTEKWIAPLEGEATDDRWDFSDEVEITGMYTKFYNVYKLFSYSIVYTAGSRASAEYKNLSPINIEYGRALTVKDNPYNVPGSTFKYWKLRVTVDEIPTTYLPGGTLKSLSVKENGIAYLDAVWEGEFSLSFSPNGSSINTYIENDGRGNVIKEEGTSVKIERLYEDAEVEKIVYTYDAYNTKPDGSGKTYYIGETVNDFKGDVVLYCMWYAGVGNIHYEKNPPISPLPGAVNIVTGNMEDQETMLSKAIVLKKNRFEVLGYEFVGWSTKPLTAIEVEAIEKDKTKYYEDLQTVIIRDTDMVLYAMWKRKNIKLVLLQNETNATVPDPLAGTYNIKYDSKLSDNAPFNTVHKRQGYKAFEDKLTVEQLQSPHEKKNFKGQFYNTNMIIRDLNTIYQFYPFWRNEEYVITMELNGGSLPKQYKKNTFIGYIDAPYMTKGNEGEPKDANGSFVPITPPKGYQFAYFSIDAAGKNKIDYTTIFKDSKNTKIYAIYTSDSVITISFEPNGGTGTMKSVKVAKGDYIRIPKNTFVRQGYLFTGWKDKYTGRSYKSLAFISPIGSMVLLAQWKTNSSGGGGGGGGGGSGSYISGNNQNQNQSQNGMQYGPGMFLDPTTYIEGMHSQVQLINGLYVLDTYGNINDPKGNIVGSTHIGDRINDGGLSFTDNKGITHYVDGKIRDVIGNIYNTDGSITAINGLTYFVNGDIGDMNNTIYHLDGTVTYVDGSVKDVNGLIHYLDGSLMTAEGIKYYTDGSILYPDGTRITPDGSVLTKLIETPKSSAITNFKYTIGSWEYNPLTDKWSYATRNANGERLLYKDQWIYAVNPLGKSAWYLVDKNGNMVIGWVKMNGDFYYMSSDDITKGEMVTGSKYINGKLYKFDEKEGFLLDFKGDPAKEYIVIGAINHISGVDGDWIVDKNTRKKVFKLNFRMEDGTILKISPKGWFMVDGHYYYFDDDGIPTVGLIVNDGKYYYMNEDGTLLEGGEKVIKGIKYIFDKATGACKESKAI